MVARGNDHGRRDVFGLDRDEVLHRLGQLDAGGQLGMHDSRQDRADLDAVRTQFFAQRVRQADHTELGGAVGRHPREAGDAWPSTQH